MAPPPPPSSKPLPVEEDDSDTCGESGESGDESEEIDIDAFFGAGKYASIVPAAVQPVLRKLYETIDDNTPERYLNRVGEVIDMYCEAFELVEEADRVARKVEKRLRSKSR